MPLSAISSISLLEVSHLNREPSILSREMKLQTSLLSAPKMNSLEDGLYLPNYNITAGLYAMPFTANQFYKNEFSNDSITQHQMTYRPQWSFQIGATSGFKRKENPGLCNWALII